MSLSSFTKSAFALVFSVIFLSAAPMNQNLTSSSATNARKTVNFSDRSFYIHLLRFKAPYQLFLKSDSEKRYPTRECWGDVVRATVQTEGYPEDWALKAGGATMIFFPVIPDITDYLVDELEIDPDVVGIAIMNAIAYCGADPGN